MRQSPQPGALAFVALFVAFNLVACSMAPYRPDPSSGIGMTDRAITKEQGAFRVSASVPGAEEAERLLGVPVYKRGIQPVWLQIENASDQRARVVLSSIDKAYFAPFEVAYMYKKDFSTQGWKDMEDYLYANALPRQVGPGQTVSGYVFTHASAGTKAFNVDIFYTGDRREYEQFTFFVPVPGFVPDHAAVDFHALYTKNQVREVDNDGLKDLLTDIPCCTTDRSGTRKGRPILLFFVAQPRDMLRSLLRTGWNETSYARDEDYLAAADYLFDRPPDAIFRKNRDNTTERAELNLWLAPVLVEGGPLWVGQFKHAIGRRYAIGEKLLGVKLDPDAVDGRNYMMQDLWYAQALEHWAWSTSGIDVSEDAPEVDFHGNPWFTRDPNRLVLWVSGKPVALAGATQMEWGKFRQGEVELP